VKDTKLSERVTLQFRAEFFDAFNRANFTMPFYMAANTTVTVPVAPNPLLGVITTAGPGRQIQAVLRLLW